MGHIPIEISVVFYNFSELTKENFSDSKTILAPQIHQSKEILGNLQRNVWFYFNNILDDDQEKYRSECGVTHL